MISYSKLVVLISLLPLFIGVHYLTYITPFNEALHNISEIKISLHMSWNLMSGSSSSSIHELKLNSA